MKLQGKPKIIDKDSNLNRKSDEPNFNDQIKNHGHKIFLDNEILLLCVKIKFLYI